MKIKPPQGVAPTSRVAKATPESRANRVQWRMRYKSPAVRIRVLDQRFKDYDFERSGGIRAVIFPLRL